MAQSVKCCVSHGDYGAREAQTGGSDACCLAKCNSSRLKT